MEPNDEQSGVRQARTSSETPPELNGHSPPLGEIQEVRMPATDQPTEIGSAPQALAPGDVQEDATPDRAAVGSANPGSWLHPGDVLGSYVVLRQLENRDGHQIYLAVLSDGVGSDEQAWSANDLFIPQPCYLLIEGTPTEHAAAAALAARGLHHPRLLAPRAVVTEGERAYLAVEMVRDAEDQLPRSVAEGARLDAEETLRAGAGLADALAYLHRAEVAHGHIDPASVLLLSDHVYLAGVEAATIIQPADAAARAADARALARVLEAVAGLPATPPPDESGAAAAVREIAARGVVDGFATAEEVGAACSAALENSVGTQVLGEEPETGIHLMLRPGVATSIGRVRAQNQDASSVMLFDVRDDVPFGMPQGVILVADGMGGEAHGELASRIAARVVSHELARAYLLPALAVPATAVLTDDADLQSGRGTVRELAEALTRAVEQANTQVRALSERLGQATGTTLTALALRGSHAVLAHVGDSRAYLLHGETLMRLTEDHSLMARLEAMDHPLLHDPAFFMSRSILYRSLGQEEDAPDLLDLPLTVGDRLLLCSDGLWDEVDDQSIGVALATAVDPVHCARQLVEMANNAGGHDNSTAIVLFVEELPIDTAGDHPIDETDDESEGESDGTTTSGE